MNPFGELSANITSWHSQWRSQDKPEPLTLFEQDVEGAESPFLTILPSYYTLAPINTAGRRMSNDNAFMNEQELRITAEALPLEYAQRIQSALRCSERYYLTVRLKPSGPQQLWRFVAVLANQ